MAVQSRRITESPITLLALILLLIALVVLVYVAAKRAETAFLVSASQHHKEDATDRRSKKTFIAEDFPRMKPSPLFHDYEVVHKYGRQALPWALEIERKYGDVDHFITHYAFSSAKTNTWNTEVYFGGRYSLTLQVEIKIDYQRRKFVQVGKPTFLLLEYLTSGLDGSNQIGTNFIFNEGQFETLVKSDWDYSSIGFDATGSPIPNFDLMVAMVRAPRYPICLTR